jgi:hypothetical protein
LVEILKGKRPLRRPTRRWEGNIKMDLNVIGWKSLNWINLAQDSDQWWVLVDIIILTFGFNKRQVIS